MRWPALLVLYSKKFFVKIKLSCPALIAGHFVFDLLVKFDINNSLAKRVKETPTHDRSFRTIDHPNEKTIISPSF